MSQHHDISPDGYDQGRDELASAAAAGSSYGGVSYSTTVTNVTGLLNAGSDGINHGISIDGTVKLFVVSINSKFLSGHQPPNTPLEKSPPLEPSIAVTSLSLDTLTT